jgi:cysteine-rich repeat protein
VRRRHLDTGETCDDGNTVSADGCASDCTVELDFTCPLASQPCVRATCGNGVVEPGESCDDPPNDGAYGGCTARCELASHCGDGVVQTSQEACDDGNPLPGDGCSPSCTVETGAR